MRATGSAINSIYKVGQNLDWMYYLIMDEARRIDLRNASHAHVNDAKKIAMTSQSGNTSQNSDKKKKKKKKDTSAKSADKWCELHKNNISHMNKNCFRHKKNVANTTNTSEVSVIADERVFFAFIQSEWILNSEAIKHVCCQKSFFDKIQFYDTCLNWNTANHIKISDIEIVILTLFNESFPHGEKIRLENVLFVSKLDINLLSLNRFRQKKYDIYFEFNLCQIRKGSEIKIEGIYWNNFIYFDFKSQQSEQALIENTDLWHARMGHIGQKALNKLSNTSKKLNTFRTRQSIKYAKYAFKSI